MKKTKVMSTITMVCFILALVWNVINITLYYFSVVKYQYDGSVVARVTFFDILPTIAGIILLIIAAKKARTGVTPPTYKLGFFFLSGALLLNVIISLIVSNGNISSFFDYIIRVILLITGYMLIAFDSVLLKPNKAMGIIGAVIIIAVSMIFSIYYSIEMRIAMPSSIYNLNELTDWFINLMRLISNYSWIQFIGIGALLYAIGRQPKDTQKPFTPNYPDGSNNIDYNNQYNYIPPQPTDQNNYQPPYNQN